MAHFVVFHKSGYYPFWTLFSAHFWRGEFRAKSRFVRTCFSGSGLHQEPRFDAGPTNVSHGGRLQREVHHLRRKERAQRGLNFLFTSLSFWEMAVYVSACTGMTNR